MILKALKELNISKKEAKVYLALLELGEANMERLTSKSAINRSTVYNVIESLAKKGLVGATKKGKRTFYYAENPRKIGKILDEKRNTFNSVLPHLLSVTNSIDKKPKIKFFEGSAGIKEVYNDTLNYADQEILVWVSQKAVESFDEDFLWKYAEKRKQNKIWQRSIGPDNKTMHHLKTTDKMYLRQSRLTSKEDLPFEVEINLYGKRFIGIMSFEEKFSLIVESSKIYNTLRAIFEINWKMFEK